jgi:hypothetical protein
MRNAFDEAIASLDARVRTYARALKKENHSSYRHTYIPFTLIPEGVAETSQIFLRDTHTFAKLLSYENYC